MTTSFKPARSHGESADGKPTRAIDNWTPSEAHKAVVRSTALALGLGEHALFSRGRRRAVSHARQVAYLVLRDHYGLTYLQIGKVFGGRDHSTVLYGVEKARRQLRQSPQLAAIVDQLGHRSDQAPQDLHIRAFRMALAERQRARREAGERCDGENHVEASNPYDRHILGRKVKPKNESAPDDSDARRRFAGVSKLSKAINAAGGWPVRPAKGVSA